MSDERPMAEEHQWTDGRFEYVADVVSSDCMTRRVGSEGPWYPSTVQSVARELLRVVSERDLELAHRQVVERQRDDKAEEILDLRIGRERLIHERDDVGERIKRLAVVAQEVEDLRALVTHQRAALYFHAQGVDGAGLSYCKVCGQVSPMALTPSDHREGCLLALGADPGPPLSQSDRRHHPNETQQPDDQQQDDHHPDDELDGLRHRDEALDQVPTQAKDDEDDQDREDRDVHGSPPRGL